MKVFLKVLAAIFSTALSVGGFILFNEDFEVIIKSFCEDPIGTTLAGLSFIGMLFILSFGPLNQLIDDHCD